MSVNLIDLFQSSVGKILVNKAASFLGEKEDGMGSALGAALPALLGGLVNKASDEKGAGAILDMIQKGGFDGGMLDNFGDLFSDNTKMSGFMNQGGGLLSSILGNKLGGIVDIISKAGGVKTGSSSSLLKMVAPLLISMIGKRVMKEGLGVKGLMNLIGGQKDYVKAAAPAGLGSLLGLSNWAKGTVETVSHKTRDIKDSVVRTGEKVGSTAAAAATTAAKETKSGLGKILPWLLLGLLAIAAFFFIKSCGEGKSVGEAMEDSVKNSTELVKSGAEATGSAIKSGAEATGDAIKSGAEATGDAIKSGADAVARVFKSISLPNGKKIEATDGGFTWSINDYISGKAKGDGKFIFDDIYFKTGSDELTDASLRQLQNLANLMDAYPKVKIRLEGHTDNTGNAQGNLDLSKRRAGQVKTALAGMGVADARMNSVGRGQSQPMVTNDTEVGRAQNRRVELYITEK